VRGEEWDGKNVDHTEFMVLALHLYHVYPESILGVVSQKAMEEERICTGVFDSRINLIFCVTEFRPGRRGPFVPAKGPKTIDAPSGPIK